MYSALVLLDNQKRMMYYWMVLVLLFLAELFYFRVADRCNIIDKPNERSSHTKVTLRGGGIIFYFGAFAYFLTSGFEYPWFLLALTLVTFISFVDDIKSTGQMTRLLFHFSAMAMMFYQWGLFSLSWWWIVIALIVCTGIINAYNFMDGINGITGGYSLVILAALAYVDKEVVSFVEADFIYTVICSVLVFCFFNFRKKAKCFAGDVGSVSIAFILLFLIGRLIIETEDFSWIVLLSVYGVDSVLTIIHRLMLHENIGLPHRKHLYQIMANELKIPHVMVSSIYMAVQAIIIVGYIMCLGYGYWYLTGIILLLCFSYTCFMKKYFGLHQST
jgi:UDP-N-acetylmuramyl pentapeptide phosphotransferase/UDP-N-acetylglucosamine-1-phosphate transferase